MTQKQKVIAAIVLVACGIGLIGWSMRDPDAAYRESDAPKVETVLTLQQVPPAVKATIERVTPAGGKVEDIQEERQGDELKYEVDVIAGAVKTEYQIGPDGAIIKQKSKQVKPK